MSRRITVAILEDEPVIRQSLEDLLTGHEAIDLEAAYASGEAALKGLLDKPVDVALCDINLPGISGIETIARLEARHPAMQFLVLSAYEDADHIFRALRAGATGYILKGQQLEQVVDAVREVHGGGAPMSSSIARKVVTEFSQWRPAVASEALSRRENEILDLLAKGFRYKEIAAKLFVSVETVRTHIHNIYSKLQVASRQEALRKAGML